MEGWLLWAGRACWQGYSAASSPMTFAASLPPSCRQSVAHALLTCGGGAPAYFTPGFAPLSLAWGWLLVGLLTSKVIEQVATRAWPSPAPPVAMGPADAAQRARAEAAAELLRCVALGGANELATAAEAGGPIASSAARRGANPSAAQCASLGPPPAPLARPRQRRPSVTCLSIEICTNSIGAPALQPFTAHSACQPAAFVQPWPLAKTVVCLSLRGQRTCPGCEALHLAHNRVQQRAWSSATWRACGQAQVVVHMAEVAAAAEAAGPAGRAASRWP